MSVLQKGGKIYRLSVTQAIDSGSVQLGVAELVESVKKRLDVVDALDANGGFDAVGCFQAESHCSRS